MSHDPASLLDALGRIPAGTTVIIETHTDSYPTGTAFLSVTKDRGSRMEYIHGKGWGCADSLEATLAQAINTAVDELAVAVSAADAAHTPTSEV